MPLSVPDLTSPQDLSPSSPVPRHVSNRSIDGFAADVARKMGYVSGASFLPILEQLGIRRRAGASGFSSVGSTLLLEVLGGRAQIFLDPDCGPLHDRFQIARALGHWTLHYLVPIQQDGASIPWLQVSRYEVDEAALHEANRFAFALLMPEEEVNAVARARDHDVLRVAEAFQVAPRIANLRLKGLGLLRAGLNPEAPGAATAAVAMEQRS